MEHHPDLSLHQLTLDDFHDVMKLLEKTFFNREPVIRATESHTQDLLESVSALVNQCLRQGICVGIRDANTSALVAVKVCSIFTRDHVGNNTMQMNDEKVAKAKAAMESVPQPEVLFDNPKVEKILYGRITNVDPKYTGRNLAHILHEASEKLGMKAGCQVFYSQVANGAILKNMIRMGCQVLHTSNLNDVSVDGKSIISRSDGGSGGTPISAIVKILIPGSVNFTSSL